MDFTSVIDVGIGGGISTLRFTLAFTLGSVAGGGMLRAAAWVFGDGGGISILGEVGGGMLRAACVLGDGGGISTLGEVGGGMLSAACVLGDGGGISTLGDVGGGMLSAAAVLGEGGGMIPLGDIGRVPSAACVFGDGGGISTLDDVGDRGSPAFGDVMYPLLMPPLRVTFFIPPGTSRGSDLGVLSSGCARDTFFGVVIVDDEGDFLVPA